MIVGEGTPALRTRALRGLARAVVLRPGPVDDMREAVYGAGIRGALRPIQGTSV